MKIIELTGRSAIDSNTSGGRVTVNQSTQIDRTIGSPFSLPKQNLTWPDGKKWEISTNKLYLKPSPTEGIKRWFSETWLGKKFGVKAPEPKVIEFQTTTDSTHGLPMLNCTYILPDGHKVTRSEFYESSESKETTIQFSIDNIPLRRSAEKLVRIGLYNRPQAIEVPPEFLDATKSMSTLVKLYSEHAAYFSKPETSETLRERLSKTEPEFIEGWSEFPITAGIVVKKKDIKHSDGTQQGTIYLYKGNITEVGPLVGPLTGKVATLNAANELLKTRGMGGIAGALNKHISEEDHQILETLGASGFNHQNNIAVSKFTSEENASSKTRPDFILHVAGPRLTGRESRQELNQLQEQIYHRYMNTFRAANQKKIKAVQIPLLSAGIFAEKLGAENKTTWLLMVKVAALRAAEDAIKQKLVDSVGIVDKDDIPIL